MTSLYDGNNAHSDGNLSVTLCYSVEIKWCQGLTELGSVDDKLRMICPNFVTRICTLCIWNRLFNVNAAI